MRAWHGRKKFYWTGPFSPPLKVRLSDLIADAKVQIKESQGRFHKEFCTCKMKLSNSKLACLRLQRLVINCLTMYEKTLVAQNKLNLLLKNRMYMSSLQLIQLKID